MEKNAHTLITIQAVLVSDRGTAWELDCEGDIAWFPKAHCSFDAEKEDLTAPIWLLEQKFPGESF